MQAPTSLALRALPVHLAQRENISLELEWLLRLIAKSVGRERTRLGQGCLIQVTARLVRLEHSKVEVA